MTEKEPEISTDQIISTIEKMIVIIEDGQTRTNQINCICSCLMGGIIILFAIRWFFGV